MLNKSTLKPAELFCADVSSKLQQLLEQHEKEQRGEKKQVYSLTSGCASLWFICDKPEFSYWSNSLAMQS